MKISIIFGTRPEAIKLAPVILALREFKTCEFNVCVTAQHREMLDQVLSVFKIKPDVDLQLMRPDQSLSSLTANAVNALDGYLEEYRPDLILVQGDTTTVFAASLVGFYHHIPVGHVEAGLRSGNMKSPWPEEANRVLTTRLASLHFAPTEKARKNLLAEGIPESKIFVTGNTVVDALSLASEIVRKNPPEIPGIDKRVLCAETGSVIVLITGHRRENFGSGFESICKAIRDLANSFPDTHFIYPVHLNPNVRRPVEDILNNHSMGDASLPNVHLIEPLAYLSFVSLMNRAKVILTDSGGIQEEAPSLGKPVLVMRDTTERPEVIAAGTAKLVGTDYGSIVTEVSRLLNDEEAYRKMAYIHFPYGDGKASQRIVDLSARYLRGELITASN
jgi:UDP-N-acetylglucosamine 2-epimerase (non-hydrolysing)